MPQRPTANDHRPTHGEAVCPYCGVGCRLWLEAGYGQLLRVKAVADAPANLGRICAKGATLDQTVAAFDRATQPLVRRGRDQELRPVRWEAALDELAGRLGRILREHGPEAVAFYGSGQLDSQAVYCAVKLFKGALGTNNTDSNSRLCMATAVAGYRSSLGCDGPPTCYDDIEQADVILVAGSNMAAAHPVTWDRIRAARKARPELRLVVVDPRRTDTADEADLHLPVRPGGDIALLNALGRLLVEDDRVDHAFVAAHTRGFEAYAAQLRALDVAALAAAAGVPLDDLARTATCSVSTAWAWGRAPPACGRSTA
jgi:assimilatory nitrate reductase catalytic subunit